MKELKVTVVCEACYKSSIKVPNDMSLQEAIYYAKNHIDEIPVGELEWISDSDSIDEDNCEFEVEFE